MKLTKRISVYAVGIVVGALAGYIYYTRVGCHSGTCMISSNPYISTGYGALLGYLLVGAFPFNQSKSKQKSIIKESNHENNFTQN